MSLKKRRRSWNKGKKGPSGKDHPMYGKKHSEEAKRKNRLAHLGKKASEETKRKMRGKTPWSKGLSAKSDERIRKSAEKNKGQKRSEETRKRMSLARKGTPAWNKGIPMSEELKRKMSIAHKKTWEDPSLRKKYVESHLGKKLSEEQKRKIGLALKGRKRPADVVEKVRLANIGKKMSEEAKRKNSEAKKKLYASGFQVWNKGKMGVMPDPWNKGIPMKEESKRKMAESHKYSIYPKTDSKPEKSLQALLTDGGIKFEKHKLFRTSGRPYFHKTDLFIEPNICIEVDSEYHHASPNVKNSDGSMKYPDNFVIWKAYKSAKEKTAGHIRAKDERITKEMEQQGNTVIRFWTNELHKNPEKCLQKIIEAIKEARK